MTDVLGVKVLVSTELLIGTSQESWFEVGVDVYGARGRTILVSIGE